MTTQIQGTSDLASGSSRCGSVFAKVRISDRDRDMGRKGFIVECECRMLSKKISLQQDLAGGDQ